MSSLLLDVEFADKNVLKELGVFSYVNVQGYSLHPPKKYKPTKQAVWYTRNLHGFVWNSGSLDNFEIANILPRVAKGEYSAKGTKERGNSCQFTG